MDREFIWHSHNEIMLIEPGGTVNTGDAGGHLTDTSEEWI
jgi:hypothetical protein